MDILTTAAPESAPAPSNRSEGLSFSTYSLSFAIAAILYALSPGPVAKFALIPSSPTPRPVRIIYGPLEYAYEKSPTVHRLYDWYFEKVWHVK